MNCPGQWQPTQEVVHAVLPLRTHNKGVYSVAMCPLMLLVAPGSPAASLRRGQQAVKSMQRTIAPDWPDLWLGPL